MKNVCIVGYGAIGPIHAEAVIKAERAKLYAVCEIDEARRKSCMEKYKIAGYEDFDEMLKDETIDSVHICTPHYLHYEMAVKALDAGKMVVCEKPVTMKREEFHKLLSHKAAKNICVVIQNRLNPSVEELKALIEEERLGKIQTIKGILTWNRTREYYRSGEWRGKWATEGGGVLINQAVHTLDLLEYFAGEILSVKACMCNFSLSQDIEVEDTAVAWLNFRDGCTGIFLATNAYGINSASEIEVVFEKGTARYIDGELLVNGEKLAKDSRPSKGKAYWGTGHERLIGDYYDRNEYFTVFDIQNTMEAMFAAYESAKRNGEEVECL